MAGLTRPAQRWGFAFVLLAIMALLYSLPAWAMMAVLWVAVVWWGVAWLFIRSYPKGVALWSSSPRRLLMSIPVLVGAWLGLNHLRTGELSLGQWDNNLFLILYTFLVVWVADIGAYFAGRAFGRRKLAPDVSPGKSWAGVYGGLTAVLLLAILIAWLGELTTLIAVQLVVVSLITAAVSVIGDLFVSMLKRHRGIKDSSKLLPGHGGVMDRVDSLVAAIPVLAFCFTQLGLLVPAA